MKIDISPKAQEALSERLKNDSENYLRISIEGFGWGGPRFGIALDKAKDEKNDYVEKVNNINIVIEKTILDQFKSFTINYSNSWFNKGFTVFPGSGTSSC